MRGRAHVDPGAVGPGANSHGHVVRQVEDEATGHGLDPAVSGTPPGTDRLDDLPVPVEGGLTGQFECLVGTDIEGQRGDLRIGAALTLTDRGTRIRRVTAAPCREGGPGPRKGRGVVDIGGDI
jgi:hypothetical protein